MIYTHLINERARRVGPPAALLTYGCRFQSMGSPQMISNWTRERRDRGLTVGHSSVTDSRTVSDNSVTDTVLVLGILFCGDTTVDTSSRSLSLSQPLPLYSLSEYRVYRLVYNLKLRRHSVHIYT